MASEYTTILATDSAFTIKRKKAIASLEGQKEYSGVWTDKEEKKLQTLKDELDTGQILPTKPDEGGITDIETEEGGWKWLEGLKSLNPFKKDKVDEGIGSFAGESPTVGNAKQIVLGLAKKWGANKAIQLATSQFGIPYQVAVIALKTPIGQSFQKDLGAMVGDTGPILGSAFQPSVTNQGTMTTSDVFQGGPPSVSSAQSQAQLIAQEEARRATAEAARRAAAEAARRAAIDAAPTHVPHGRDEGPSEEQQKFERSGADANRGFTKTKYGKAYQRGGLVGVDYLTRRL